ncbi:MAG: intradiol ring-cleavage dioxygenase [Candidatus Protistobacter heckmanni]|nr:intradiol ring-cleavage dioxygenase [Candidatus Protistobacter heckmanni]
MRDLNEDTITQEVLARQANAGDARLKEIMTSLVQHLHSFAREVKLTEAEWFQGIQFLTQTGHMCDDERQEFILLSDSLGLSMLVTALNNRKPQGCTEATVFGPFHVEDAPHYESGEDLGQGVKGLPLYVNGRVTGFDGKPVAGAAIDIWHADGFYDVQYADNPAARGRGVMHSDAQGRFYFKTALPASYPIPHDGPVGKMLEALNRHPWRPAHVHFMIQAEGYERLVTHVFRDGDTYLDSDAVFGVRNSLIADWIEHSPGAAPDGLTLDTPFYTLDFEFVLNPAAGSAARKAA